MDLSIRERQDVKCLELDILDWDNHEAFYNSLDKKPYGVITAVGYLGDQKLGEKSFSEVEKSLYQLGNMSLLNIIANDFEERGNGFIIGLSSIAGDRGRQKNYFWKDIQSRFHLVIRIRNRLYKKYSSTHS